MKCRREMTSASSAAKWHRKMKSISISKKPSAHRRNIINTAQRKKKYREEMKNAEREIPAKRNVKIDNRNAENMKMATKMKYFIEMFGPSHVIVVNREKYGFENNRKYLTAKKIGRENLRAMKWKMKKEKNNQWRNEREIEKWSLAATKIPRSLEEMSIHNRNATSKIISPHREESPVMSKMKRNKRKKEKWSHIEMKRKVKSKYSLYKASAEKSISRLKCRPYGEKHRNIYNKSMTSKPHGVIIEERRNNEAHQSKKWSHISYEEKFSWNERNEEAVFETSR